MFKHGGTPVKTKVHNQLGHSRLIHIRAILMRCQDIHDVYLQTKRCAAELLDAVKLLYHSLCVCVCVCVCVRVVRVCARVRVCVPVNQQVSLPRAHTLSHTTTQTLFLFLATTRVSLSHTHTPHLPFRLHFDSLVRACVCVFFGQHIHTHIYTYICIYLQFISIFTVF